MKTRSRNQKRPFEFQLDLRSGVPLYRQVIDQVMGGIATGSLAGGDQLPTVRQLAVDLSINPNTVVRAYRELEIRGVLETQQGTGTFVSHQKIERDEVERQRRLDELVGQFVARAGAAGFSLQELLQRIQEQQQ
jgi:GntR family transcriptional regulator